jgi:hypothetical protein
MAVDPSQIIITSQDFYDAEDFLVEYLSESIPEASFERGSALRDFAVSSFVLIYAYLRGEANGIRVRQSVHALTEEIDKGTPDLDESLDQVLSNWFITRREGSKSRMTAQVHFSKKENISISTATAFWRDVSHAFYLDISTDPYVISSTSLFPNFDSRGNLIDYVADIPLIAGAAGDAYSIAPGRFARVVTVTGNIPNLTYVEHQVAATSALNNEDSSTLLARSQTAIAVRNLINNRSVDTTLKESFSSVESTLTVGMGDPEMQRDLRTELGSHIQLHVGGKYDTFVEMADQTVEEFGLVGGYFPRPDRIINVFRDPEVTRDPVNPYPFTAADRSLEVGHIINIRSGILEAPRAYQIIRIEDHELYVSEAMPFTEASDEEDTSVSYSLGWFSPDFDQSELEFVAGTHVRTAARSAVAGLEHIPAGTSRYIQSPGAILLEGRPVQDITRVELIDPSGADSNYIDPATGTIMFSQRVNGSPGVAPPVPVDLSTLSYQLEVLNPRKNQSEFAVSRIMVGFSGDESYFDDRTLRVTYITAAGFSNPSEYTRSYNDRVVAADHLLRMRHPIWIEAVIPYRLKRTADTSITDVSVSTPMANYINLFDPNDDLDVSDLATAFRNFASEVGTVFTFDIYYNLYAPDGQVAAFKTTDIVSIYMTSGNGVELLNGLDIQVPPEMVAKGITEISTNSHLTEWYNLMGISDKTIKYRTRSDLMNSVLQG